MKGIHQVTKKNVSFFFLVHIPFVISLSSLDMQYVNVSSQSS